MQMSKLTKSNIRDVSERLLRQRQDIAAAYLLGSAARQGMRTDSDVDIAVMPAAGQSLSAESRLELAGALGLALGGPIDLGIITPGNLIYAAEAILNGERIFVADEDSVALESAQLLGCYIQLRSDRMEVEEAYVAA